MNHKQDIAVLISGGGTTLRNLIETRQSGLLRANVKGVISSCPQARGIQFARDAGLPVRVFDWRQSSGAEALSESVFDQLDRWQVDWVVLGGFLRRLVIPSSYNHRVINIHPSLIPAFCGQGMYGKRVHQAVLDFGARISGCTVHFVDNEFDHGPILDQRAVKVLEHDTADSLAARIFEVECQLYPEVINRLVSERIEVNGRHVKFTQC